jgi:hypothetical protein
VTARPRRVLGRTPRDVATESAFKERREADEGLAAARALVEPHDEPIRGKGDDGHQLALLGLVGVQAAPQMLPFAVCHGPDYFALPTRAARDLRAASGNRHRPSPGDAPSPRPLPGGDGCSPRRRRLPRFIERELRDFPGCGDLERGFARGALRHLPVRTPRPVLMQGPRDLSQLLRAADGGVLVPRRDGRGCAPLFTGRALRALYPACSTPRSA